MYETRLSKISWHSLFNVLMFVNVLFIISIYVCIYSHGTHQLTDIVRKNPHSILINGCVSIARSLEPYLYYYEKLGKSGNIGLPTSPSLPFMMSRQFLWKEKKNFFFYYEEHVTYEFLLLLLLSLMIFKQCWRIFSSHLYR